MTKIKYYVYFKLLPYKLYYVAGMQKVSSSLAGSGKMENGKNGNLSQGGQF